ncbi:hypothetical protein AB0392_60450 [Nonomuraea angiospora]|uniref:hypothetical protein n=1 Tax=Nonomuraea angiospora TaxID=46172 RepID=UPI00344BEB39
MIGIFAASWSMGCEVLGHMPSKGCDLVSLAAKSGEVLPYLDLDVADLGLQLGHVGGGAIVAATLARFERAEVQQQLEDLCL